ncbi:CTD kinase subunit gamma CTK3-domain-containing protein [Cercophora newfieldiana]|uniref:CTD kinase subunit gamma CTK3-domain-containing protein n=1 Tax=Cercophora newfieldiana TaxID=92897 RepID=A0AA40CPU4_9PEZI|nr:CTD kinase subunit gamma CTK3-domain-containing protein [Cercophora newfieldiana]
MNPPEHPKLNRVVPPAETSPPNIHTLSSPPQTTSTMTDPFEVRMRFTNQLRGLNASVTSAQKAAQFALKHKDLAEDLHSCILEQLERNGMNTRANIMYFIEHFLDLAQRADGSGHADYIRMMQRDIIRVVDAVAPEDGSGAANIKLTRKVLQTLQAKNFLEAQVVLQIEEVLKDRVVSAQKLAAAANGGGDGQERRPPQPLKLDRKQIEQRIEEDRERHKRLRENIWAVPSKEYGELEKMWEETSDLGEDDFRAMAEERREWDREFEVEESACPHRSAAGGATNGSSTLDGHDLGVSRV